MTKHFIFLALAVLSSAGTRISAQQVRSSYTSNERKGIVAEAKRTLETLKGVLLTAADTVDQYTQEDLLAVIADKFGGPGKIFFNKQVPIDDDTDPNNTVSGEGVVPAEQYLNAYRIRVRVGGASAISIENENLVEDAIYAGNPSGGNPYNFIRVKYTLKVKGVTTTGKPMAARRSMIASMAVIDGAKGAKVQTLITGIDFASKDLPAPCCGVVRITGGGSKESENTEPSFPPVYFQEKFNKGVTYADQDDYIHAWYALSQASKGSAYAEKAEAEMKKLNARILRKGLDNVEDVYAGLTAEAARLGKSYRYEEAIRYYQTARDVKPGRADEVGKAIKELRAKRDAEQHWLDLLEKGSVAEARRGMEDMVRKDNANVNMLAGLGRVSAAEENKTGMDTFFARALRLDEKNGDTYWAYGRSLLLFKDFGRAADALRNYKIFAQEEADPEADSYLSYAKGMALVKNKEYSAALNELSKSERPEAKLERARLHLEEAQTKDYKTAEQLTAEVLKAAPANATAHYLQAYHLLRTRTAENSDRNTDRAIESYQQAVAYAPENFLWHTYLADLLIKRGRYEEAVKVYNGFLTNNPKPHAVAYHYRGRALVLASRYNEAESDYKVFAEKMAPPPAVFFVDYAKLLRLKREFDRADTMLQKAGGDKDALLEKAVLSYARNDAETVYIPLFRQAFNRGNHREAVTNDPQIRSLYAESRAFKKLLKEFSYPALK